MRRITALIAAMTIVGCMAAGSASAHNNRWLFPYNAIRAHKVRLQYSLNYLFGDRFGPQQVTCRGLNRERATDGTWGYHHIRCRAEDLNIPDFIYHINGQGREVVTRSW